MNIRTFVVGAAFLTCALLSQPAAAGPLTRDQTVEARIVATKGNVACERDCWEMWRAGNLGLLIVIRGPDGRIREVKAGRHDLAKAFTSEHDRTRNAAPLHYAPRIVIVDSTLSDANCSSSCAAVVEFEHGSIILFLDSQGRAAFATVWPGPADVTTNRSGRPEDGVSPMGDAPCTGSSRVSCTDWQISADGSIVIVIEYDRFGNPIGYEIYVDGRLVSIDGDREQQ